MGLAATAALWTADFDTLFESPGRVSIWLTVPVAQIVSSILIERGSSNGSLTAAHRMTGGFPMNDNAVPYAMSRTLQLSYQEADHAIRDALLSEGFGILTEADVSATFKKKLGVDIGNYEILGACAPPLAFQALQHEPDAGLLLPCNVVVRSGTHPGETIVEALDPVVQLGVARNRGLLPMAEEVRARLERALDTVTGVPSTRT